MAVTAAEALPRPAWPVPDTLDTAPMYVHYDPLADELLVYFGGRPVPKYVSPIGAPAGDYAAVLVGMDENDDPSAEIVGLHVMPLLVGAVQKHPKWAILAWGALTDFRYEEEMLRSALADFVAEVRDIFDRYWTPPPPIEEQLARLPRPGSAEGGDEASRG